MFDIRSNTANKSILTLTDIRYITHSILNALYKLIWF